MIKPKRSRVIVFPADLERLAGGSTRTSYRLYSQIRAQFKLEKGKRITIYHVRDFFQISLEDVENAIF